MSLWSVIGTFQKIKNQIKKIKTQRKLQLHPQKHMQSLTDQKNCLLTILTCLICQQRASYAHSCPNCSKFFCFICIQTWVCQKTNQCPYCQEKLQQNQLINCQKLCTDLSKALDFMDQPKTKIIKKCKQHNLEFNYFCSTCQAQICSDCCALTLQHQGHRFLKSSTAKRQFQKQVNRIKLLINIEKQNIKNLIKQKEHFSTNFQTNIQKDTKKFTQFAKNLKERTEKSCLNEIISLQKIIQSQKGIAKEFLQIYDQNLQFIKECPKIQFVLTKSNEIKEKLQSHIHELKSSNRILQQKVDQYNQKQLQSKILPLFAGKTFSLSNFWNLYQQNEMIYTDILSINGLQWRLKIYPDGIPDDSEPIKQINQKQKSIQESYLSVFVELKSSIRQKGKYKHKVVIESERMINKKIQREFESEFQRGECWGYDKFAKINYLYDNGFISEKDELKITLMIGAANYYEASQDLKAFINIRRDQLLLTPKQEN